MLQSLCLIPVDYYFFYWYYYSKVAISTFPHICLGSELEREIKQQQKSYNFKEKKKKKRKRASLGPSSWCGGRCSVCFSVDFFQLFWCSKENRKTAAGKSCLASTEITISEKCDLIPSGGAPQPQLGKVQAQLCVLGMQKDRIHFPVALGCFCLVYSTNRAVFWQIGWILLKNQFQFCSIASEKSQAKTKPTLCNFYSKQQWKNPVCERNAPLSSYFTHRHK